MSNATKNNYFFYNPTRQQFIGIDNDSGGYPYWTDNPISAMMWKDKTLALAYINSFPEWKVNTELRLFNVLHCITIQQN